MTNGATAPVLRFVHLSDIHFSRKHDGGVYDLDADLRNEIERDVELMRGRRGNADAILITGDVAFSGQEKEYAVAADWLKKLCGIAGCAVENVLTVPGNHDVDRKIVEKSSLLRLVHTELRTCVAQDLDDALISKLRDDAQAYALMHSPQVEYNAFAAKYGCNVTLAQPRWQHDFTLADGSTLSVVGLNSALVSNRDDNVARLVLGAHQTNLMRRSGTTYMTLCHHPPSWLRDGEEAAKALRERVHVQLYGHRHEADVLQMGNSVVVAAGAVHPSRDEAIWAPHYNVIEVSILSETPRKLSVMVWPRSWSRDAKRFGPKIDPRTATEERHHLLSLDPWTPPAAAPEPTIPSASPPLPSSKEAETMVSRRKLVFRFLNLTYDRRIQIADELSLIRDEDKKLSEPDFTLRLLQRAAELGQLEKVWAAVERESPTSTAAATRANPTETKDA